MYACFVCMRVWGGGSVSKVLGKPKDPSLEPQCSRKEPGAVMYTLEIGFLQQTGQTAHTTWELQVQRETLVPKTKYRAEQ